MESNGNREIEHRKGTTGKQWTQRVIAFVNPLSHAKHGNTHAKSQDGASHFIDPVLVNGILNKVGYAENKDENTNLSE